MKKALALLLVLVLALSMSTVAFAKQKVKKNDPFNGNANWWDGFNGATDVGEVFAADNDSTDIVIPLNAANFKWEKVGNTTDARATNSTTLTTTEINDSKIIPKLKATKGSQVIDEVELKKTGWADDNTRIIVNFVYPFKSNNTDGVDFEFKVYLSIDGKQYSKDEDALTFTGTYKNDNDEVDADTDYYYFGDGNIMKPTEFIRVMEGDMGEGVVVNMRALKKAKYWGVANQDLTDDDQELMIKYSTIDQVYHLSNIGIQAVANYVTLDDADPTAYVYDGDLNYLGRGNARLPFAETYYLAAAELDVDDDADAPDDLGDEDFGDEDLGDEDYVPGDNTNSGGDDLYPSNVNDNPGTGK